MRKLILALLPLATLAIPSPLAPSSSLAKREAIVPYIVEDRCTKKEKMIKAVKGARELAQDAVQEWWYNGQHREIAATYLAIPNTSGEEYYNNEWVKLVKENLERVGLLSEAVPLFSKYIVGWVCCWLVGERLHVANYNRQDVSCALLVLWVELSVGG
jgi:hypothetical protein